MMLVTTGDVMGASVNIVPTKMYAWSPDTMPGKCLKDVRKIFRLCLLPIQGWLPYLKVVLKFQHF